VQRTRKDRVAQLDDLLDDDRAHVVLLELHAPGLGVGGAGGSALQVLELALRQVNRHVSKPLLELRAPLVRPLELLRVVEPAPRLVPLNLLLEPWRRGPVCACTRVCWCRHKSVHKYILRMQLVLLDCTPLCFGAAWPFTRARADKILFRVNWFRINLGDLTPVVLFEVAVRAFVVRVTCVLF